MAAGGSTPAYGSGDGPQDGQIKPIPVPAPPRDRQSEAERLMLARREARRKNLNGILAASGGFATIAFLVLGFAFNAWAWAWVVFLIPPLLRNYLGASQ